MSDTADRVKKIVVEHLGVEADKVTEDASFIDDLGADSLDIVELITAVEDRYDVELPEEELEHMKNAGDLWKFLEASRAARASTLNGCSIATRLLLRSHTRNIGPSLLSGSPLSTIRTAKSCRSNPSWITTTGTSYQYPHPQ